MESHNSKSLEIFIKSWMESASLGLDVFPASNQISPTVPLALHYDTNSSDWQKIFMYGESPNIHIRDQQNFFPFQAH